MKTLTIDELYAKSKALAAGELIIDVRTPDEYAAGHVPGSQNISHDEITAHAGELAKQKQVYLYCRSGARVQYALHELELQGVKNAAGVVSGGMPDWARNGYPVER